VKPIERIVRVLNCFVLENNTVIFLKRTEQFELKLILLKRKALT